MSALERHTVCALVTCHAAAPDDTLLAQVLAQVPRVLVVDDAMPGAAALELDSRAAGSGIEVLHLPRRAGKGHAIAAGLSRLRDAGDWPQGVLVIDGDGQHPPERIPDFLAASAQADLVIGNRFDCPRDIPLVRRVANRIANRVLTRRTGTPMLDSQCGMRLLRGRALDDVAFTGGGYEAETLHLRRCVQAGVAVGWVAIPAIYEGQPSSFRHVRDSAAVLRAAVASG